MSDPKTRRFDLVALLSGPRYCASCATRVCDGVRALDGVRSADCDPSEGTLHITYDPTRVRDRDLDDAVARLALEAVGAVEHAAYRLTGLD